MMSFTRILPKLALSAAVVAMMGGTFAKPSEAGEISYSGFGYPLFPTLSGYTGDQCQQSCTPAVEPKIIFVTSETYNGGEVGGLAGADEKCQDLADAVNSSEYPYGLPGTYKAWLSITTGSPNPPMEPAERFIPKSAGPYIRPDGALIATSYSDLTDAKEFAHLASRIEVAEDGTFLPTNTFVWTNTAADGTTLGEVDCNGWVSTEGDGFIGSVGSLNGGWTNNQPVGCANSLHLYCVQQ